MTALDASLPPALFDVDEQDGMRPPRFETVALGAHGPALTPYGAHEDLGPGVWDDFPGICGEALYAAIESWGRRVWIYHVCSAIGEHEEHDCDRCTHTWKDR